MESSAHRPSGCLHKSDSDARTTLNDEKVQNAGPIEAFFLNDKLIEQEETNSRQKLELKTLKIRERQLLLELHHKTRLAFRGPWYRKVKPKSGGEPTIECTLYNHMLCAAEHLFIPRDLARDLSSFTRALSRIVDKNVLGQNLSIESNFKYMTLHFIDMGGVLAKFVASNDEVAYKKWLVTHTKRGTPFRIVFISVHLLPNTALDAAPLSANQTPARTTSKDGPMEPSRQKNTGVRRGANRVIKRSKDLTTHGGMNVEQSCDESKVDIDNSTYSRRERVDRGRKVGFVDLGAGVNLEESEDEEIRVFGCSGCGAYGVNLDEGTDVISCAKCKVWQHMKCLGISQSEAAKPDFTFPCGNCRRREESTPPRPRRPRRGMTFYSPDELGARVDEGSLDLAQKNTPTSKPTSIASHQTYDLLEPENISRSHRAWSTLSRSLSKSLSKYIGVRKITSLKARKEATKASSPLKNTIISEGPFRGDPGRVPATQGRNAQHTVLDRNAASKGDDKNEDIRMHSADDKSLGNDFHDSRIPITFFPEKAQPMHGWLHVESKRNFQRGESREPEPTDDAAQWEIESSQEEGEIRE